MWKIGTVAKRTGLSVRALQYYEEIALVIPSARTAAGHRVYSEHDLERLQRILSLRSLGLTIAQARQCLDDPGFSPLALLELQATRLRAELDQKQLLCARIEGLARQLRTRGSLEPEQLFEVMEAMMKVEEYFSAEQIEKLRANPATKSDGPWKRLLDQIRRQMDQGTASSDPALRPLIEGWYGLGKQFSGGDPAMADAFRAFYRQEPAYLEQWGVTAEVVAYVDRAAKAHGIRA